MTVRLPLIAVAALLAAGCGGGVTRDVDGSDAAAAVGSDDRVGSAGVTVALPTGWKAAIPDDGNVTDPRPRVVVASAPIATNGSACQVAHYDFPADAVALVVLEWQDPLADHSPRPARFSADNLPVQPPPAGECFAGSAGTVQFSDHGRAFDAYLLAGRGAQERLIDDARRALDTLQVEGKGNAAGGRLERNGISIEIPGGWDGRLLFREPSGRDGVIFQVADFMLPANSGFDRPRARRLGQEDPIKAMDEAAVLLTVIDGAERGSPAPRPLTLGALAPVHGARVPAGHIVARGNFCVDARCVSVEVDFGGVDAPRELVRSVDEVLSSLRVTATSG